MTRDAVLMQAAADRLQKKRVKRPGLARYAPKPMVPKLSNFSRQQSY